MRKGQGMSKATNEGIEILLYQEALTDLENERQGKSPLVGEMQRRFPDEYKIARELMLGMAKRLPLIALSIQQAEKISEMIHSEDEGLSSIQDVLNMQPVNALTLTHLVRLERQCIANKGAEARHSKPGASRENRAKVRAAWMSGKYRTRDKCAEAESKKMNMSLSTARKALINTPDLPSRCK